jgi:hypothetical protein
MSCWRKLNSLLLIGAGKPQTASVGLIANPQLNNDPGTIIALADETFGLVASDGVEMVCLSSF